jgi:hypothetical protein
MDEYGYRLLANRHHLPGELVWYTEGYEVPCQSVDNSTLPELQAFKERHKDYVPPSFTMDVVRFSHKIFAVVDALKDHDDLGVWIDADVIPTADMPESYVRAQLPDDCYIALFKRKGTYSECGYWVVNCKHPGHGAFMEALRKMYVDDAFVDASEWHDSYLMDLIIRNLESRGVIKSHSLTDSAAEKEDHVMALSDIARYMDHCKGPERKAKGHSPERVCATNNS